MPPLLRHFSGPPVLPPVPELSFDILDGLSFEFDTLNTPPSATFTSPQLHSPIPVKLMTSRLIPRPPPSSLADVPEGLSDIEEGDEGRALATALPDYFTPSPSPTRERFGFAIPDEGVLKPTAPLNIRKKMSTSPSAGLAPLRVQHRVTLPDCPRSPTPEYRSVEPLHPLIASIVNGDMREGGLPEELASEPGARTLPNRPDAISPSTHTHIPRGSPSPNSPFQLPPGVECTCGNCDPPPFAQGALPPVPDTSRSTPSPRRSPRTRTTEHPGHAPVRPVPLPPAVHDEDGHDHHGWADVDRRVPPAHEWDTQFARSRDALDPPAALHAPRATPSPQPSLASNAPPRPPRPQRPPRPTDGLGLNIAHLEPFEPPPPAHLVHLTLERTYPHYEKSYPASTRGSVHSRRPSEPETGSLGSLRDALAEGTKAFVTTLNKRHEERRRSVYSHRRGSESETWAPSEFDPPPPTTNAKAVSLLGHHDRRHDRRGSDTDELQLNLAPRPFPGATSKAAALLGIGVAEPAPAKRFGKFSSPKAAPNALHAIRRTQPTGWSGAGAGATMKRMSQYALQMMEDDIDFNDALEPPAPVSHTPYEEEVTVAPGPGQSFTPLSARLSVHGASARGSSPGSSPDDRAPSPLGSGHPFAATPAARAPQQPRIRPEGTSPSGQSLHSTSSRSQYSPPSVYSQSSASGSSPSSQLSRAPTALQRRSTLKARPPPISVERVSPTRDYPLVEVPTPSTAMPRVVTPSTARTALPAEDDEPPRLKSHILAKYRLIEPPIAATDPRNSTSTTTTTASGTTGTSTESSGRSISGDTYTSRESYSTRESYADSLHSLRSAASHESFGSMASGMPSSGASLTRADTMSGASLSRVATTSSMRDDKSLTARLNRHVRNASSASSTTSALSAVNSATATLRAAASATLSWGMGTRVAPGMTMSENGVPHDVPAHMSTQPAPWHNYNIRYDKDGREIPNLTPRPPAAPPVEESWFEPSTPISPVDGEGSKLQAVGSLVRRGWKKK